MKVLGMTDALTSPISSSGSLVLFLRAPFARPASRISKDRPSAFKLLDRGSFTAGFFLPSEKRLLKVKIIDFIASVE